MGLNESLTGRRIHTDEDCYDMMYWSIKFGVSIDRLLEAVAKVGSLALDVERQLNGGTAVMPEPLAPNPVRHVLHFRGVSGVGLADRKIVQPDPAVFVVRKAHYR